MIRATARSALTTPSGERKMSDWAVQSVLQALRGQRFSTAEIRQILIELRITWDEADQAIEEMFLGRSDLPALTDIQKIIDHED
jgi:hypothetical protein